jgi:phage tail-like protein
MAFPIPPPPWSQSLGLPMTHRFMVSFLTRGTTPNPLDIRFQEVTGLQATISTRPDPSASAFLSKRLIPTGIDFADLELKRGVMIGSPLSHEIQTTLNEFRFVRSDVLVTVLSEQAVPTSAFLFVEAYPISWQIASLSAERENVLIETMKLTYTRMRTLSL